MAAVAAAVGRDRAPRGIRQAPAGGRPGPRGKEGEGGIRDSDPGVGVLQTEASGTVSCWPLPLQSDANVLPEASARRRAGGGPAGKGGTAGLAPPCLVSGSGSGSRRSINNCLAYEAPWGVEFHPGRLQKSVTHSVDHPVYVRGMHSNPTHQ